MNNLPTPLLPFIQNNEKSIIRYTILDYIYKGFFTTNSVTLCKLSDNTFEVYQKKECLFKSTTTTTSFTNYSQAFNYYSKLTKEFYL